MRWMVATGAVLLAGCATGGPLRQQSASGEPFVLQTESGEAVGEALTRIEALNRDGPNLYAVLATLPVRNVAEQAAKLDVEASDGRRRGPLHGRPVLLKDNIAIAGQPTTAGSLALKNNVAAADAPLVARLRNAGLVILGRTNLSEWANIRSTNSTSGWSAIGGLTVNPWGAGRNACGSSSGSAAAVAARLAPLAVGTETDGSITCPAGVNGVVGFKPSLGVVSGVGVVPIAHSQDTAGPMARTVADAAALLDAMRTDGRAMGPLPSGALNGVRVGVLRDRIGDDAEIVAAFDTALDGLTAAGATLVEITDSRSGLDGLGEAELTVLLAELKTDIAAYLATTDPARVPHRTLADLIAFNKANPEELRYFDQDLFEQAQAGPTGCSIVASWTVTSAEATPPLEPVSAALKQANPQCDPRYVDALVKAKTLATGKLTSLLRDNDVAVLVGVTNGPAWLSTLGEGDNFGGPSVAQLPAIAGAPHLTVPMALVRGLPVGMSFIGQVGDDARVLAIGAGYEATRPALPPPPPLAP